MIFVFAHGAGAPSTSPWMKRYARALEKRGLRVVTFDFPKTRSSMEPLEDAFRAVIEKTHAKFPDERIAIGGKSMGGRVASLIAAKYKLPVERLVFFGYPLHPPGKPEKRRDAHLPDVKQPMLFVQGARDPFGNEKEMRALTKKLGAKLLVIDGGNHSLEVRGAKRSAPSKRGARGAQPLDHLVPKRGVEKQSDVDARIWDAAAAFVQSK